MSDAVRTLNYDGIFIYRRGQTMSTLRLVHKRDQNGEKERLISLSGKAREVLRNNETVTCIFPDNGLVLVEKTRPGELLSNHIPKSLEAISASYTLALAGRDRIAGRNAWVASIRPEDNYRYGYQLWIDKENHLLLKSQLINKTGFPLEEIMFTKIETYDAIPDELLEPSISGKNLIWHHNVNALSDSKEKERNWKVSWMPEGFILRKYERQPTQTHSRMEHLLLTDGLALVSVFIEKTGATTGVSSGPSNVGGLNAFARYADGHQVTVVGEVPRATVQKMANSVVSLY